MSLCCIFCFTRHSHWHPATSPRLLVRSLFYSRAMLPLCAMPPGLEHYCSNRLLRYPRVTVGVFHKQRTSYTANTQPFVWSLLSQRQSVYVKHLDNPAIRSLPFILCDNNVRHQTCQADGRLRYSRSQHPHHHQKGLYDRQLAWNGHRRLHNQTI